MAQDLQSIPWFIGAAHLHRLTTVDVGQSCGAGGSRIETICSSST